MDETPVSEIHPASCGAISSPSAKQATKISVQVCPTTGGNFSLEILNSETIDGLKKAINRKLKVTKERINVLHKDRILKDGTLAENNVVDGSRLTLLPNVESGLVSQKAEHTVMQALENLSDSQVNEFLAGKAPLTLAMRLGDHMMFVQLQLSTSNPGKKSSSGRSLKHKASNSTRVSSPAASSLNSATATTINSNNNNNNNDIDSQIPCTSSGSATNLPNDFIPTGGKPTLNTAALAQASRNLSQKLRELSAVSAQLQKSTEPSITTPSTSTATTNKKAPGAIIESMQHHGHGVYSGTFSGTLNPALQDTEGKPKKDVSTIIHILNDLLGAQPHSRGQASGKSSSRRGQDRSRNLKSKLSGVEKIRLTQENRATKGKMAQLKAMLEERRQKRRERQEAKTTEQYTWDMRERNSSDSSMTEGEEMDIDANVEASLTDSVADTEAAYPNIAHETILA